MFPYKRIPAHLTKSVPDGWAIGRSDSGWMVSSTFYEYMANVFYPWCLKQKVQFPVIFFLDGYKSHLSLELSDFCNKHQIILVALFPNATHIIQPCDVAIFRALKYKWKEAVQLHKQETQTALTKATFAPLFKKAFDQLSVDSIKNGFIKCGLYPFDENAVNYDQCISTRRQQLNSAPVEKSISLSYDDLISTKKFFEFTLKEEKLKEFDDIRKNNKKCSDSEYLLWKTCIDNLELLNEDKCEDENVIEMNKENVTGIDEHTEQNLEFLDSNDDLVLDTSDRDLSTSLKPCQSLSEESNVFNVEFECSSDNLIDSTKLCQSPSEEKDMVNSINILNIPVIDICDINLLDQISSINSNIDKLNSIKVICTEEAIENLSLSNQVSTLKTNEENMTESTLKVNELHVSNEIARDSSLDDHEKDDVDECTNGFSPNENSKESTNSKFKYLSYMLRYNNYNIFSDSSNDLQDSKLDHDSQCDNTPDVWTKHLHWPSSSKNTNKTKKKTEQLPFVLTSSQWRELEEKKRIEKEKKEMETQERLLQRKIKKEEAEEKKKKLKYERDMKNQEKARIKEEKDGLKNEKKLIEKENLHSNQQLATKNPNNLKRKLKSAIKIESIKKKPLKKVDLNVELNDDVIDLTIKK